MRIERLKAWSRRSSRKSDPAIFQFSISNSQFREAERGFTLAGLLIILSIIAVVVAYTVPKQWSQIRKREREQQTIFVMKQYARAISDYQRARGTLPTSFQQLEEQKSPRVLRQTYKNPLSGELDWIIVPAGTPTPAQTGTAVAQGGMPSGATDTNPKGTRSPNGQPKPPAGNPKDFSGPFIGVRPPQTGESFLTFEGQTSYDGWMYTVNEVLRDQQALAGPKIPGGSGPGGSGTAKP